jgi:CRP-like cAMP-binding protein
MSNQELPRTGILAFMDTDARLKLASFGTHVTTTAGEVLLREGETNTRLYIVLEGTFNITTRASGSEVHLDTVSHGDCLGEVAIFNPDKASATVTSVRAGALWSIEAESLQEFLNESPEGGCAAILGINVILSRRLGRANAVIRSNEIVPSFLSVRSRKRSATASLS